MFVVVVFKVDVGWLNVCCCCQRMLVFVVAVAAAGVYYLCFKSFWLL